jgi:DNA polymerase III subunit gamma/tau
MFENLVGQGAGKLLIDDILNNRLPPSMLFSGPVASGKLTAALELARVLSCGEGSARWTCACGSCSRHKELTHPDVLVLGSRDCALEIRAARDAFLRKGSSATRYLFIRSVRKLMLRFGEPLQDQGDAKAGKMAPILSELEERLEELAPFRPLPEDPAALAKLADAIVAAAEKLEDDFLPDSIPVQQVRNAAAWVRLSPSGKKKVLIVENADRMQEGARNAFLKVLEEPPDNAVFVLTTTRRGAVMPTILSRVRTYAFVDRAEPAQKEVISRVFHDVPREGELLETYFNRFLPVSPEAIGTASRAFLETVLADAIDMGRKPLSALRTTLDAKTSTDDKSSTDAMSATDAGAVIAPTITMAQLVASLNKCKPPVVFRLFLARVTRIMRIALRSSSIDAREIAVYSRWTDAVRNALDACAIYNIGAQAALERLAEEMKAAL